MDDEYDADVDMEHGLPSSSPFFQPPAAKSIYGWDTLPKQLHQIFRRSNFRNDNHPAVIPSDYYQHMYPALQLASQMLISRQSLSFWYGAMHNVTETLGESNVNATFRAQANMTRSQINETLKWLEELAERIFFCPQLPDGFPPVSGVTGPSHHCGLGTQEGRHSLISLDKSLVLAVRSSDLDDKDAQLNDLRLAVTIVHEVAHAGNRLLRGDGKGEMFFEDEETNEIGFAYENFLFGGTLEIWWTGDITVTAWPHHNLHEAHGATRTRQRRKPVGPDQISLVRENGIDKFFRAAFWEMQSDDTGRPLVLSTMKRTVPAQSILGIQTPDEALSAMTRWYWYTRCRCQRTKVTCETCMDFELDFVIV